VAEWLRSGLQNRLPRFNSGRGLQPSLLRSFGSANQIKACFQSRHGFVIGSIRARAAALFPGSSVVEQPAVNRLVAGSNPARGAKQSQALSVIAGRAVRTSKIGFGSSSGSIVQNSLRSSPRKRLRRWR
jgi:hypothetical protein